MSRQGGNKAILMCAYAVSGLFYCLAVVRSEFKILPGLTAPPPPVMINEIAWMGSPTDANQEWIELKNNTGEAIDLAGWSLAALDGTPSTTLAGVVEPEGFFLLERMGDQSVASVTADQIYAGALGNAGETLELKDSSGQVIDRLDAAAGWPGGYNGTKATLERTADLNWQTSLEIGGTPRAANGQAAATSSAASDAGAAATTTATSTVATASSTAETMATTTPSSTPQTVIVGGTASPRAVEAEVVINEFLPNPRGNDAVGEWIELHNIGYTLADLSGWKIAANDKQFLFSASGSPTTLPPGGFLVLKRSSTRLVLPNDRGQLFLFSPESAIPRQAVSYEDAAEGQSFVRNDLGGWQWSEAVSEGQANAIVAPNLPPEVDWSATTTAVAGESVLFDSSDTVDPEDDKLSFRWQFGDGATSSEPSPEHIFVRAGKYNVKLTIGDGRQSAAKERSMTVIEPKPAKAAPKTGVIAAATSSPLILSEILPNPAGEDAEEEWIELFNRSLETIEFLYWQLDDAPGGSSAYRVSESVKLAPQSYYLVSRADSRLALNNGGDEVRLFNAAGELADQIRFGPAKEGWSYARSSSGAWLWTSEPTPLAPHKAVAKPVPGKSQARPAAKKVAAVKIASPSVQAGRRTVEGTVIALPGQLGKQIFYIDDPASWEIYSYRQDFPRLALGDRVRVSGELGQADGVPRLKTKSQADIKLLQHAPAPRPLALRCVELGSRHLGRLVSLEGEVTKKTSSLGYLDDGTAEAAIAWSKLGSASLANLQEGQTAVLAGIVTKTAGGLRLSPRGPFDLAVPAAVAASVPPAAALPEVIPVRRQRLEAIQYGQLLLAGSALALVGWLIKRRQQY